MVDCRIIEKLPSAAEYNHLRALVGWGVYQEDVIDRFLPNSLYCVCAFMGAEIVGMAAAAAPHHVDRVLEAAWQECRRQSL